MPEMYAIIEALCQQAGTNITEMCRQLGISRSSLSELKSNRTKCLSADSMAKIAAYFGVSTDTLLGAGPTPATTAAETLSPIYFRFGKQAQDMGLSEHDMQFLLDFMSDHRRRNTPSGGDT